MSEQDDRAGNAASAWRSLQAGADVDDVIRAMREGGLSVIDCIEVLYTSGQYTADEAKDVVFNSAAWADKKEVHKTFHDELIRGIDDELESGR